MHRASQKEMVASHSASCGAVSPLPSPAPSPVGSFDLHSQKHNLIALDWQILAPHDNCWNWVGE